MCFRFWFSRQLRELLSITLRIFVLLYSDFCFGFSYFRLCVGFAAIHGFVQIGVIILVCPVSNTVGLFVNLDFLFCVLVKYLCVTQVSECRDIALVLFSFLFPSATRTKLLRVSASNLGHSVRVMNLKMPFMQFTWTRGLGSCES